MSETTLQETESQVITKVEFESSRSAERIHVRSGDVYTFACDVSTRAGHVHPRNSLLYVHDSTLTAPFNEIGPHGVNWICRTQFSISVWATLETCIERGLLRRIEPSKHLD